MTSGGPGPMAELWGDTSLNWVCSKGGELEATDALPDVGMIDQIEVAHAAVMPTFWNTSAENLTKRRNLLFSAATGLSINDFCVDELHTMHLGVFQS